MVGENEIFTEDKTARKIGELECSC